MYFGYTGGESDPQLRDSHDDMLSARHKRSIAMKKFFFVSSVSFSIL